MQENVIDHEGVIDEIVNGIIRVRISSLSACATCHAKGACSTGDTEDKYVDVPAYGRDFHTGDMVKVSIARHTGFRAVAIGYLYPFVLLMTGLITLTSLGVDELHAGLYSLGLMVPYYLTIYLLRNRINRKFSFTLHKL